MKYLAALAVLLLTGCSYFVVQERSLDESVSNTRPGPIPIAGKRSDGQTVVLNARALTPMAPPRDGLVRVRSIDPVLVGGIVTWAVDGALLAPALGLLGNYGVCLEHTSVTYCDDEGVLAGSILVSFGIASTIAAVVLTAVGAERPRYVLRGHLDLATGSVRF